MEKKRFGLIEVMVRTLFFTKTYKNLSKPNIWIYLIGSRSEQEIHSEPYPNGKSPSQFEETIQHQFDRLCKLALKGEKIDYIRHMEYLRKNEVMLSELSQKELDQLAIYDEYDLESYKFQVLNYDIEVKDALIAEALTSLTKRKRDVILLSYFMGMSDAEIARKMKLVRSTVNEHRKRSLEILKDVMEEKADESEM